MRGLFVTGTDTGVGKTFITAGIVATLRDRGHPVGVFKPVATGAEVDSGGSSRWPDAEALLAAVGDDVPLECVCPLRFEAPLAPPVAAREAGRLLQPQEVLEAVARSLAWWHGTRGAEIMVIEGVGGLLCPLAEGMTVADLAAALDFPVLVVARLGLGTLNHTLLTVEAAVSRGLRLAGIVLNEIAPRGDDRAVATNPIELARWLPVEVPIVAVVPPLYSSTIHASGLWAAKNGVNWTDYCLPSR